MTLAQLLKHHWADYVARAGGVTKIPTPHWRAVEAVLSCRTSRLGGHVHHCGDCGHQHYAYHSCNHRSCPSCGGHEQQLWAAKQQARLLPVPYFMVTFTLPEQLRRFFMRYPYIGYTTLFASANSAVQTLFENKKHYGGQHGAIAVLHTWTRQIQFHPHIHMILPAVALNTQTCEVIHQKNPDYLFPYQALAEHYRNHFHAQLKNNHPHLSQQIDPQIWDLDWNVNIQSVGRGKSALRYLAAYVSKSAFNQSRLKGYDAEGNIKVAWTDSSDGRQKIMTLPPHELIRRWLLHVLPKGFTRLRYYGFLSPAARKNYLRLRFLLGASRVGKTPPLKNEPMTCPHCNGSMQCRRKIMPARGPPLSAQLLRNQ